MLKKKRVPIVFEDDAVIVCEKPAGMPVQSDHTRDMDVLTILKHHIFEEQNSEEEPYLAVVHRLDRPVGGLMVLAKTKEAAANLSEQIQNFEFEKNYQAVVCGNLREDFGTFEDYLLKNGKTNKTEVVKAGTPGARKAELDYELIDCIETKEGVLTWILVILHTGRHHQIRVQFASRGLGLYGDTKYNPKFQKTKKKYTEIGLYSTRISFNHPVTGERMTFKIEPSGEAFEKLDFRVSRISNALSKTPSFFCWIGMIIVCTGAILGGNTSPLSSPCTMMIAPMIRVDIPHEVSYTGESLFSLFVYSIPKAFANPLPKLWLVPDCNALQSCINASIV